MIATSEFNKEIDLIIANAIREDVGTGDHSSLACIPSDAVPVRRSQSNLSDQADCNAECLQ